MLTKTKFAAAALAALVLVGGLTAGAGQAEAHRFHKGFHVGFGWGCRWVPKFNILGDYVGSIRACRW
jgi:hypothetical protein